MVQLPPGAPVCPNYFPRSNSPGYLHPVSSELENSGIGVAIGDCSVTERRRWRPPYQTGKTVHVHTKHYEHNKDRRTAPVVCVNGSVPPGVIKFFFQPLVQDKWPVKIHLS